MKKVSAKKSATKQKLVTVTEVPQGFTVAQAEGSFGVTHDFHKDAICTGKCVGIKTVKTDDGPRRVMTVKTAEGERNVWESAQLKGVFDVKAIKGKLVFFRYDGKSKPFKITKGKAKGKTVRANQFTAAYK